jgi:hypothetical protein
MQIDKPNLSLLFILLFGIHTIVSAQLSPKDAISQMKKGINMGNTLEGPNGGDWGNPFPEEYYFDRYKNEGFNFVRIPVRWDNHLGKTTPFKIDENWFSRVEQILDWGLSKGLYIVVNSHHDDWIKTGYADPVNRARFDSLWSQIAVRFKNKSEKLIFEICNEPVNISKANTDEMHKNAIAVIRKTNPTRLIIFQGTDWGGSDGLINAAIPNDKYIIGSFHSYDPYPFGLVGTGTFGSAADINTLKAKFQSLKNWSDKNNIPVFLGEFGGTSKCDYNSRMKQYKTYMELSETFGFAPCAWDDGGEFRIFYRQTQTWFDDIKDILTHSSVKSPKISNLSIVQDSIVKLTWTNMATDYDSIYIERRTSATTFIRIAALKGSSNTFSEYNLKSNIEYYYRVVGHYNTNPDLYSNPLKILMPVDISKIRKPFTGKALVIPGKIEAEYFDIGGEGFTYHDSDTKNITALFRPDEAIDIYDKGNGAFLVADNYPGEWVEYTVNVSEKGLYDITASTAAFAGGGTFQVKIGAVESEIIVAPTSYSWYNTKTVIFSMNLDAGVQIMRLGFIAKPLFNIDYLEFTRNTTASNKNLIKNQFNVFQNQQELIFNLEMDHTIETMNFYNILGSVVKTIQKPEANFRISTQYFHSGVYIVQLISGNQKFSKKIIIQ